MRIAWLLAIAACSGSTGAAFRATDPAFTPRPGPLPPVYLERGDVPAVSVRSVGVIEVKARSRKRALESAAEKGAELGCWASIEHHVFEDMNQAQLLFGARVRLAHGGVPHTSSMTRSLVLELHCVVRADRA